MPTMQHGLHTAVPDDPVARAQGGARRAPAFRARRNAAIHHVAHGSAAACSIDALPYRRGVSLFASRAPMIEQLKEKLEAEANRLQHELNVTLPAEIRRAVELGDLRENSEYKSALERQQFVQARLGQLRQRLSKLSQIDLAQIPADKVGLGSRVTVEDVKTGITEIYDLVFGDSVDFEDGHVTMSSPIGRALVNRGVGEVALLKLPATTRQLRIVEILTIHQQSVEAK